MEYYRLFQACLDLEREGQARVQAKVDLRARAAALAEAGHTQEAEDAYRRLLALDARDASVWHELGRLYIGAGRLADAGEALLRALSLDATQVRCHFDFGMVARQVCPAPPVLASHLQILGLAGPQVTPPDAASDDVLASAEAECRLACERHPDQPESYSKLGHVLIARGKVARAAEAYEAASHLRPADTALAESLAAALHLNGEHDRASLLMGHAYYRDGRYGEAIDRYRQGLAGSANTSKAYVELAHALNRLHRHGEAIEPCLEGIRRYPTTPDLYCEWVTALLGINRTEEAVAAATLAAERFPDSVSLAHQRDLALPVLYETAEDITRWRKRFADGLERICRETILDGADAARETLKAVSTNFYLSYQGLDDTDLQRQYGQLARRIMCANYPAYAEAPPMPDLEIDERIRVGYVSASITWAGVGELFLGWLARRNPTSFETYVYNVGESEDLVTRQFEFASDHYHWLPRSLDSVCEQVRADRLHMLVFLEVGMNPRMTQLAALRLAPVQAATFAHSITTGLPSLDYFISAEFFEPEKGQEHYSERLVLLPNIGMCPRRPFPPTPEKTRARLGIDEDAVVYLSPQTFSKYLPQYDDLYPAIAQRVPAAQFLFKSRQPQECIDLLRARLLQAFARRGLEGERYLRFVPPLDYLNYMDLYLISDVFLDTLGWSGGFTTLDALGCALPVVTCPGEFMRGRQSFAFLQQLGVTDTVAANPAEYVEFAARLGLDAAWRASVRQRISQRLDRLYDEEERVQGLERLYRRVVQEQLEKESP